jgi:hypothetical protein
MSQKNLVSLQKEIVLNRHTPLRERLRILKQMDRTSERFLRKILDSDAPDELRRAAVSRLVALLAPPKPKTVEPTSLPTPRPSAEENEATIRAELESLSPEMRDFLGLPPTSKPSPTAAEVEKAAEAAPETRITTSEPRP